MANIQPDGYLAYPSTGRGSPVLVLHAWWGLNDTIKAFCDRLAEAGFVVFAPDLYHGKVVDTIAEAEKMSNTLDDNHARSDIAGAVSFLNQRAGQNDHGLAVIGFSLGAYLALELTVTAPELVRSVVVFYGTYMGDFNKTQAHYLGHFAETDQFESLSDVNNLEETLKQAGRPVTFYHYKDTGHWFFEPDRPDAYHQAAADLAWDRTIAFLNRPITD
jgi:carboxymethylenebutenolidase